MVARKGPTAGRRPGNREGYCFPSQPGGNRDRVKRMPPRGKREERGRVTRLAGARFDCIRAQFFDDFIKLFPLRHIYLQVTTAISDICFYLQ